MKYFKTDVEVVAVSEDSPELLRVFAHDTAHARQGVEHQTFKSEGEPENAVCEHFRMKCVNPVERTIQITREEFLVELDRSMTAIRDFRERI